LRGDGSQDSYGNGLCREAAPGKGIIAGTGTTGVIPVLNKTPGYYQNPSVPSMFAEIEKA